MAKFDDHISQAKRNFTFLENANNTLIDCFDWQVTVCFYTALHLVNGHLATFGNQFRKHSAVKNAINPENHSLQSKLPEDEYVSYITLMSLSRRSRYMVNDKDLGSETAFLIHEIHLAKALRHLDKLVIYFKTKYSLSFPTIEVKCAEIKNPQELVHIRVKHQ